MARLPGRFDAVVFDYGGVFTSSPFGAVERMAEELGATASVLVEVVFGAYDDDTDHPWHRLERGEIKLEVARTEILALGASHGFEADLFRFFKAMASNGMRTELIDCVRKLRRDGYRTGILTNNIAEFREYWRGSLPLAELFDDVVDSCEVGLRKPNPKIFELAAERLGTTPDRAIFLDDHPGNVRAARLVGMEAVLVGPDALQAIRELERVLERPV